MFREWQLLLPYFNGSFNERSPKASIAILSLAYVPNDLIYFDDDESMWILLQNLFFGESVLYSVRRSILQQWPNGKGSDYTSGAILLFIIK